jgi:release factor glutamine methyltransferase
MSWRELWADAAALLDGVEGVGDPLREARWICEHASGASGAEFDAALGEWVAQRPGLAVRDALVRRVEGEPLQYVLGHWAFRRLEVLVDPRVVIPRPETELLVEAVLEWQRGGRAVRGDAPRDGAPLRIADLGTGSGVVGLALATEMPRGAAEIWLTDSSTGALEVARANLAGIGMAGAEVRVVQGDWWAALPESLRGRLDVVVSNPPYVALDDPALAAGVRDWEPHAALFAGPDGVDALRAIAAGAPEWLAPGGLLALEIGATQAEPVRALLAAAGLVDIQIRADLAGHPRIALATRPT